MFLVTNENMGLCLYMPDKKKFDNAIYLINFNIDPINVLFIEMKSSLLGMLIRFELNSVSFCC